MNRFRFFIAFLLSSLALPPQAQADEVPNLYETEVPVASQAPDLRKQALQSAFGVVLTKVSGVGSAASEPGIKETLAKPEAYVQQYLYREAAQGQTGLRFWVRFDASSVDQLLRKSRLPVWGRTRPGTLVWLALEDKGERRLLGADETEPVAAAMLARAERRGLPLHFPLLDLQDLERIQATDVWGDFRDIIEAASGRYHAQAILVAALRRDGERYRARYTLYRGNQSVRWDSLGALDHVVGAGVDRATDELAASFSQASGEPTAVTMQVRGLRNLDDYSRTMGYLHKLSGVSRVEMVSMGDDRVVYRLTLQTAVRNLVQAIELGEALVPDREPDATPGQTDLNYRLLQ